MTPFINNLLKGFRVISELFRRSLGELREEKRKNDCLEIITLLMSSINLYTTLRTGLDFA